MKKIKNNFKGITLIALVVTIIVLLILAGVAINLTIGNNGVLKKADMASKIWNEESKIEEAEMENFTKDYDKILQNNNGQEQIPNEKTEISINLYPEDSTPTLYKSAFVVKITAHPEYLNENQTYTLYYKKTIEKEYKVLIENSTSPIPISSEYFENQNSYDFYVQCIDKYGRKIQSEVYTVLMSGEHSGGEI